MVGISPWRVGQLSPAWTIPITDDTGASVNLTGVLAGAFTLTIYETTYGATRAGAGVFSIVTANPGVVQYQWAAADVAQAGAFTLTVSWTANGDAEDSDPVPWVVKPVGAP